MTRIDRQIPRPGLEHRHNRDDRLNRTLAQQPHHNTGTHPPIGEQTRQPVRRLVKLAVSQRHITTHHRHRIRRAPHLRIPQPRDRHRTRHRAGQHSPVVPPGQSVALSLIEHIHRRQPLTRISHQRLQDAQIISSEPLHSALIEHIPGVLKPAWERLRIPIYRRQFRNPNEEVEHRGSGGCGQRLNAQTREVHLSNRVVVQREHHLEQRMMGIGPHRMQQLHQPLKRRILVLIGPQSLIPHPPQQLSETRITRQVDPQHPRIDEKPDKIIQRSIGTPSDRHPDRHIITSPQPGQQHRQPRLQHHRRGRPELPRPHPDPLNQLRLDGELHQPTPKRLLSRTRPIERQHDLLGRPRQLRPPILQLPRQHTAGIINTTQHLTLPQRVIGVLHPQRHPPRPTTPTPRGIRHRQVPL